MERERIRFLVDENGRKRSVVLPIKEYPGLLGDLGDLLTLAKKKYEPAQPLDVVNMRLEAKWQNTRSK